MGGREGGGADREDCVVTARKERAGGRYAKLSCFNSASVLSMKVITDKNKKRDSVKTNVSDLDPASAAPLECVMTLLYAESR